FLDEAIVELARSFAAQERLDRFAALKKFGAVVPAAVGRVSAGDANRIARVPGILGGALFARRSHAKTAAVAGAVASGHAPVILVSQMDDGEVASLPLEPNRFGLKRLALQLFWLEHDLFRKTGFHFSGSCSSVPRSQGGNTMPLCSCRSAVFTLAVISAG